MITIQIRRTVKTVALTSLLGLATLGLSQCRMVSDNVTGVEIESTDTYNGRGKADCVKRCNDEFKAAKRSEDARHKAAVRACGNDRVCKKDAGKLNKDNLKDIIRDMQECKRGCYNEGGGIGGR